LTEALHVSQQLQLSPSLPSSLAPMKPANPGSHGKMAVKAERDLQVVFMNITCGENAVEY